MKIIANNIGKKFGENWLWSNFSFEINSGETVCITGVSGSGKTTLLNSIGALEKLTSGSISVDEKVVNPISGTNWAKLYRYLFGFLFQNYALVDNWSVYQNIALSFEYLKTKPTDKKQQVRSLLNKVGLNNIDLDSKIYRLSGGEQQRVALARTLLKQPKIILCDEPSAALDSNNTDIVLSILKDFAASGGIVIIASHDPQVINRCDRAIDIKLSSI